MTGDPTKDPNFTGVKQPAFDRLVSSHVRAAAQLDQLGTDLWAQLTRLGADTGPAVKILGLARRTRQEATELQRRQRLVHDMERDSGAGLRVPSGTFWELSEPRTPSPRPGPPVTPVLQPAAGDLSWELRGAMFLPPAYVPAGSSLAAFSAKEKALISWIQANRETILREARRWNISARAIVAAIAWEALENPQFHVQAPAIPVSVPTGPSLNWIWLAGHQSAGPGKVHIDTDVVKQIEGRGYLPPRSLWERQSILTTPEGSIKYIAAIMGGFADVTDQIGRKDGGIRTNVPVLAQLYQGSDLNQWEDRLREINGERDWKGYEPLNPMAVWAGQHPDLLKIALLGQDGTDPTKAQGPPATVEPPRVIPPRTVGPPTPIPSPGARPTPP